MSASGRSKIVVLCILIWTLRGNRELFVRYREGGREGERVRGGKEASQVVLEQSTSSNAVYQSHHKSRHIIKFSTNTEKLTFFLCRWIESRLSLTLFIPFLYLLACIPQRRRVHTRVMLCTPLRQTDRHFIEVVFNACLDITVAGSSIRLQDNIDHLPWRERGVVIICY